MFYCYWFVCFVYFGGRGEVERCGYINISIYLLQIRHAVTEPAVWIILFRIVCGILVRIPDARRVVDCVGGDGEGGQGWEVVV